MYLARRLTDRSYPMIGRHFGGRVHHTVMHAERRIETLRATDPRIEADVLAITAKLSQPQPQGLRHSEGAM
jgi:chromosomal replication initiator protein